jgi:hypothetical protein
VKMAPHQLPSQDQLSVLVALVIEAQPYRCWRNAALAMHLLPSLFSSWHYIEGWAVLPRETGIEIIEHGWIARTTRIVDPSFLLIEHPDQPIFYFPGLSLSWEQLQQCLPGSILPLVCHTDYGETGMAHHGYQAAYEQAWHHARDLAQQKQLPTTTIQVRRRASQKGVTLL